MVDLIRGDLEHSRVTIQLLAVEHDYRFPRQDGQAHLHEAGGCGAALAPGEPS